MPRFNRIAMAQSAIAAFPDRIKQHGKFRPATASAPAFWHFQDQGLSMVLAQGVLRSPNDASLSTLLDIWKDGSSGKVLSVSWEPERPWQPLHISSFKGALLQSVLDESSIT